MSNPPQHSPHPATKENHHTLIRPVPLIQPNHLRRSETSLTKPILSPRKTLPSPPTSTPSCTPPLIGKKRKSVVFNEACLGSAQSVPNHRSRPHVPQPRSKPSVSIRGPLPGQLQPALELRSGELFDRRKRARLSLATPRSSPSSRPSYALCASADKPRPRPTSPLAARSSVKSLDRFYYHGIPLAPRPASPTLLASAPAKKELKSGQLKKRKENLDEALDSESSDDEVVVRELLPRNSPVNGSRVRPLEGSQTGVVRRAASFPGFDLPSPENDDQLGLRPILKKTQAQILLADSVEQGTRSNGRPKLAFEALIFPNRARMASKALLAVTGASEERLNNLSTCAPVGTAVPVASSSTTQPTSRAPSRAFNPKDDDQSGSGDDASSSATDDGAENMGTTSVTREESLLASIRSSLLTLQASLFPPPKEMRLDPLSPLASLTSPQRKQQGQLGNLIGSPREPRDLLPRALVNNPRLEPTELKAKAKRRRTLVCSSVGARPSSNSATTVFSPALPRTPEQPTRPNPSLPHTLPRIVITLREVEEAYLCLHENLSALRHHWHDDSLLDEREEHDRLSKVFDEPLAGSLMTCLVRELENLCRLKSEPQPPPPQTDARDQLSRPSPTLASNRYSSPAVMSTAPKVGSSTNEIRRRVAEIETGQAGLRCLGLLWSWPSTLGHLAPAHAQRLLSLLVELPGSDILRRKKHLPVIGTFNHIIKAQRLPPAILTPHAHRILDAITHTLYLSGGKSGEKGKRVLWLGLGAIKQLVSQIPEQVLGRIAAVIEPLLAALASPQAGSLRHEALQGLGALVNCTKKDWDEGGLRPSAAVWRLTGPAVTADRVQSQKLRKEDFQEKLSRYTFAYLTNQPELQRWQMLNQQLSNSLAGGELSWPISAMATVMALLGKRLRRTDPPVTKCFKPHIQILLKSDGPVKQLAQQLWDYYILVMLIWSIEHIQTHKVNNIWGLEKAQLAFFLQIFHQSYFWSPSTPTPVTAPPANIMKSPSVAINSGIVKDLDALLRPGGSTEHAPTNQHASRMTNATTGNSGTGNTFLSTFATRTRQPKLEAAPKASTLHRNLSAFLYGTIGCVQQYLPRPMPFSSTTSSVIVGPKDWLESVISSARFSQLDIIWDEIVERALPGLLAGPIEEHRIYACQILVALCGGEGGQEPVWTLDRFIHPVFHQPPPRSDGSVGIDLEAFAIAGVSSLIKPMEIPSMDMLWICCRSNKVLKLVNRAIRAGPESEILEVWQAYVRALKRVRETWAVMECKFKDSLAELMSSLEALAPNWITFSSFYAILKNEMGEDSLSEAVSRLASFLLHPSTLANVDGEAQRQEQLGTLVGTVLDDLVRSRKAAGAPEKLAELGAELARLTSGLGTRSWLRDVVERASARTTADVVKLVEVGVDCWEEAPIENWCVELVKLNLCSSSDVAMALVRLLGRASVETFQRLMLGSGCSIVRFLGDSGSTAGEVEQLYRICLSKFTSSFQTGNEELEKVMVKIIRSPFFPTDGSPAPIYVHEALIEFSNTDAGRKLLKDIDELIPKPAHPPTPITFAPHVEADRSILSPLRKRPENESLESYRSNSPSPVKVAETANDQALVVEHSVLQQQEDNEIAEQSAEVENEPLGSGLEQELIRTPKKHGDHISRRDDTSPPSTRARSPNIRQTQEVVVEQAADVSTSKRRGKETSKRPEPVLVVTVPRKRRRSSRRNTADSQSDSVAEPSEDDAIVGVGDCNPVSLVRKRLVAKITNRETSSSGSSSEEVKMTPEQVNKEGRAHKRRRTQLSRDGVKDAKATVGREEKGNRSGRKTRSSSVKDRETDLLGSSPDGDGELGSATGLDDLESVVDESATDVLTVARGSLDELGEATALDETASVVASQRLNAIEAEAQVESVLIDSALFEESVVEPVALDEAGMATSSQAASPTEPIAEVAVSKPSASDPDGRTPQPVDGEADLSARLDACQSVCQVAVENAGLRDIQDVTGASAIEDAHLSSSSSREVTAGSHNALLSEIETCPPLEHRDVVMIPSSPNTLRPNSPSAPDKLMELVDHQNHQSPDRPGQNVVNALTHSKRSPSSQTSGRSLTPSVDNKKDREQSAITGQATIAISDSQRARLSLMSPAGSKVRSSSLVSGSGETAAPALASDKGPVCDLAQPVVTPSPKTLVEVMKSQVTTGRTSAGTGVSTRSSHDLLQRAAIPLNDGLLKTTNSSISGSLSTPLVESDIISDSQRARLSLMSPATGMMMKGVTKSGSFPCDAATSTSVDESRLQDAVQNDKAPVGDEARPVVSSISDISLASSVEVIKVQELASSEEMLGRTSDGHPQVQSSNNDLQVIVTAADLGDFQPYTSSSSNSTANSIPSTEGDPLIPLGLVGPVISDSQRARLSLMGPAGVTQKKSGQMSSSSVNSKNTMANLERLVQRPKRGGEAFLDSGSMKVAEVVEAMAETKQAAAGELRSPNVLAFVGKDMPSGGGLVETKEKVQLSDPRMSLLVGRSCNPPSSDEGEELGGHRGSQELVRATSEAITTAVTHNLENETTAGEASPLVLPTTPDPEDVSRGCEASSNNSVLEFVGPSKASEDPSYPNPAPVDAIEALNAVSNEDAHHSVMMDHPGNKSAVMSDQLQAVGTSGKEACHAREVRAVSQPPVLPELVKSSPSKQRPGRRVGETEACVPVVVIEPSPLKCPKARRMSMRQASQTDRDTAYTQPFTRSRSQARAGSDRCQSTDSQAGLEESLIDANQPGSYSELDRGSSNEHMSQSGAGHHTNAPEKDGCSEKPARQAVTALEEVALPSSNGNRPRSERSSKSRVRGGQNEISRPRAPTKRTRTFDVGSSSSNVMCEDQPPLYRVMRASTSRANEGRQINQQLTENADLSLSKLEPRSLSVVAQASSFSSETQILGRSLRPRGNKKTTGSVLDEGVDAKSGNMSEMDDEGETTQEIRAQVEGLSTDTLLKLSRVATSVIEERVTRNRKGSKSSKRSVN
ncbi:hypothetical protein CROQUDRAFT_657843 [Cronartium quercuum f. sp. fusiforme G11]|uniref:Uncharacterized protein n=1 Tax=Cronartium quercuum f. sp. fusiforme G11 TaxID=708437 RepID=A0A9P6NFR3_9BASI|nr:hypothetical protein CROQUDRAFT_657843 [Cronartium quercuum f. sp. fusiforme G11]